MYDIDDSNSSTPISFRHYFNNIIVSDSGQLVGQSKIPEFRKYGVFSSDDTSKNKINSGCKRERGIYGYIYGRQNGGRIFYF